MLLARSALDLHLKSVLLATDLSPASVKPFHHALAIARRYGAKLFVAHIVSPVPYLMAGPETLQLACEGASQDLQQLRRDMLRDSSLDGLDREFILRFGSVWEELQAIISQQRVDLVVVGTNARRGIEKVLLGSIAEQVFRDASCPVLSVGPLSYQEGRVDLTAQIPTYLFATDFSEASLHALPLASSLAHQTKARLILLHVVPAAPAPQIPGRYSSSEIMAMRENVQMTCVRQLQQLVPDNGEAPIDTEFLVRFGISREKILQVALETKVDLIILGLRRASLAGTISRDRVRCRMSRADRGGVMNRRQSPGESAKSQLSFNRGWTYRLIHGQNHEHTRGGAASVYMIRCAVRATRAISSSISCFSQQLNS